MHFVESQKLAGDSSRQVVKLATFTVILVAKIFYSSHGNQNGRSLEHCVRTLHVSKVTRKCETVMKLWEIAKKA